MSSYFSNNGYVFGNGRQSPLHREHAIHSSIGRGGIFNPKASPKRMETKILIAIFTWVGLGSYIAGIFLNLATWKSDVMFAFGLGFIFIKLIRLIIKTWQAYKREEIEQDILRKRGNKS